LSSQPPAPTPPGTVSPDGRYVWDGSQWAPNTGAPNPIPPPAVKKGHLVRNVLLGVGGLFLLVFIIGVAAGGSKGTTTTSAPTPVSASDKALADKIAADQAAAKAAVGQAAIDKAVADNAAAKAAADKAAADKAAAAAPQTFSGTGSKVTGHFNLQKKAYKVSWSAQGGPSNFAVYIRGTGKNLLVNEIPPNPSSGETVFDSGGGDFFLEVEGSTLTWTITFAGA
jgi:hypothetical protein